MRSSCTFFLGLISVLSLTTGCDRREPIANRPVTKLEDLEGTYREKGALQAPAPLADETSAAIDNLEYNEFVIKGGTLSYRRQNPTTLEAREDAIGTVGNTPKKGVFELKPQAGLNQLAQTHADLKPMQAWFDGTTRVRVLLVGDQLKITEVRGSHRLTRSLVRQTINAPTPQDTPFEKAKAKAHEFAELRQAFLEKWRNKSMVLFENVEKKTARQSGRTVIRVTSGDKIPDETIPKDDNGQNLRKRLNFKRLQILSPTEALINGQHAAEVQFFMTRKHRSAGRDGQQQIAERRNLYLRVISMADPKIYQEAMTIGLIEDDGKDGFQLVHQPSHIRRAPYQSLSHRYQLQGTNSATPTEPTAPDEDDEKPPKEEGADEAQRPPRKDGSTPKTAKSGSTATPAPKS